MSEISQFFARLPRVTRILFLATIVISSGGVLGLLPPQYVLLSWQLVKNEWEIWRPLTALFYANMSQLSGLMDIYALYSFSKGIEEAKFFHNTADYAFYLFLVIPLIQACSLLLAPGSLLLPLTSALTYTWSRANRFNQVMVYFMKVQAEYLPLAMLIFTFLLMGGQPFFSALSGLSAAYFYQCLESKTLGPVYGWICEMLGVDVTRTGRTQRVGTIHTMNQTEGPLKAPRWFAGFIDSLTGDARIRALNKGKADSLRANSRIGGFSDLEEKESSSSSGFSFGRSSFKGSGHRLGSE